MSQLEIEQSSATHPGRLTHEDLALLQPPGSPPIKLRLTNTDLTRRDAGAIWIIVEWLAAGIAGGTISACGKDIYEWVKLRTKGVMQKKAEETRAAPSPYPLRDPAWEIKVELRDGDRSLSISLKATDPDKMERAAEMLAERLNDRLLPFREDKHWSFEQTLNDVEFHEVVLK